MSFRPHHVEIDGGLLRGSRPCPGAGDFVFLVDVIEDDGAHLGVWSGPDYPTAILEAEHARREFEIGEPVRDLVGVPF